MMSYSEEGRAAWDRMARSNAMHYILSGRENWTPEEFFAVGERFIATEVLPRLLPAVGRVRAVDLGCGIGRLARPLAAHFQEVIGLDISSEMIARAREINVDRLNVKFQACSGAGLEGVSDASCDLAFSYIVLQHIPDKSVVWRYFSEFARVLRPGGQVLAQVSTERRTIARRIKLGLRAALGGVADAIGIRRLYSKRPREPFNWGYPVPAAELEAHLRSIGMDSISFEGRDTATTWISARRP